MNRNNARRTLLAALVIAACTGSESLYSNLTNDTIPVRGDETFLPRISTLPQISSLPQTPAPSGNVIAVSTKSPLEKLSVVIPVTEPEEIQIFEWKDIENEARPLTACGQQAMCKTRYAFERDLNTSTIVDEEMINYYNRAKYTDNWLGYLKIAYSPNDMPNRTFIGSQCHCDPLCANYGDCCQDAARQRWHQQDQSPYWSCLPLDSNALHWDNYLLNYIYMVGRCPSNYPDKSVVRYCEAPKQSTPPHEYSYIMDIPVLSATTNLTYANVYCARCHDDMQLVNWNISLACTSRDVQQYNLAEFIRGARYTPGNRTFTKRMNLRENGTLWDQTVQCIVTTENFHNVKQYLKATNGRRCLPQVRHCHPKWPHAADRTKCSLYALYIITAKDVVYKNPHCALCNRVPLNVTRCFRPHVPKYPLSLLFDPSAYITRDYDERAGGGSSMKRCPDNQFWDHLHERCHAITCGSQFDNIKGVCTPKDTHSKIQLKSHINSTCPRVTLQSDEFTLLPNDSIYVNKTNSICGLGEYESNPFNNTVQICALNSTDRLIKFNSVQSYLSNITLIISTICLALHMIIHAILPKLRNLPGKNLLSLSFVLFFAQLLFLTGIDQTEHKGTCVFLGMSIHWFFLAAFFWMSVMSFDVCRTFSNRTFRPTSGRNSFKYYSLYAWGVPTIIIIFALLTDYTNMLPAIAPHYGDRICWISNRPGLTVFFLVPVSILLFENCVLFGITVRGIYAQTQITRYATKSTSKSQHRTNLNTNSSKTKRSTVLSAWRSKGQKSKDTLVVKPNSNGQSSKIRSHNEKRNKIRLILYVKLSVIMGLGWLFGFIAALSRVPDLWYVFIIFNGLQGAFIFLSFDVKRKIYYMLWERMKGQPHPASQGSSRKQISSSGATRTTTRTTANHRRTTVTSDTTDTEFANSDTGLNHQRSRSNKGKQSSKRGPHTHTNLDSSLKKTGSEVGLQNQQETAPPIFPSYEEVTSRRSRQPRERTRSIDVTQTEKWPAPPLNRLRSSSLQCNLSDSRRPSTFNTVGRASTGGIGMQPVTPKRDTERKEKDRLSLLQMNNRSALNVDMIRPRRSIGNANDYESPRSRTHTSRSSKV